jgi:hypothetical protein
MSPFILPIAANWACHSRAEDADHAKTWRFFVLPRISDITHPTGSLARLPKLVPSFSSKGFARCTSETTGAEISRASEALQAVGGTIKGAFLISAFDIFHNLLESPETYYTGKELIFIDSGGYELSGSLDGTEPREVDETPSLPFTKDNYASVLSRLPEDLPFVVANFDFGTHGMGMNEQIKSASALLRGYPSFLHNFIAKPTSKRAKYLNMEEIISHLEDMRCFHILGVTEREIGNTILSRLVNIATLRRAMDEHGIAMPIHIWGGLDPITTPMYFCAGAEIFDGVSWMRYGYYNDMSVPRDAYTALEMGVQAKPGPSTYLRYANNLNYLETLELRMEKFVSEGCSNFAVFATHAEMMEASYRAMMSKLKRKRR